MSYFFFRSYEPSTCVIGFVFVNSLVPVMDIKIAPMGAVTTILKMQTIKIISAYSRSASLFSAVRRRNVTGPNAA